MSADPLTIIRSLLPYAESRAEDLTGEAEDWARQHGADDLGAMHARQAAAKAWLAVEAAHAFLGTSTRKSVLAGTPPDGLETDRVLSDVEEG